MINLILQKRQPIIYGDGEQTRCFSDIDDCIYCLDKLLFDKSIKEEFSELVRLLDFRKVGYELFRKWYVDGRLYFHVIIDDRNPKRGILELRPIDPLKIKKVRQPRITEGSQGPELDTSGYQEYYLFQFLNLCIQKL